MRGQAEGNRTRLQGNRAQANITADVIAQEAGCKVLAFCAILEEILMVLRRRDPTGGFEVMSKSRWGTAHE
jgi:hypothetical protein